MILFLSGFLFIFLCVVFLIFADADATTHFYEVLYTLTPFGAIKSNQLEGKVVWITGASSGIGEALAYELAACNCKLVLSARRRAVLEEVKKTCLSLAFVNSDSDESSNVLVLPFDILDNDVHPKMANAVVQHFGRIDILVNNAGRSQRGLAYETNMDVYRALINLDLIAQISLTKSVLPYMKDQRSGQILAIGSISGKIGVPLSSGYCAAKFALMGFFSSLAFELAEWNVTISMACPGPVKTPVVQNSFGTTLHNRIDRPSVFINHLQMPASRCARLLHVALRAKLSEVWITRQPILLTTYLSQYCPGIYRFVSSRALLKYIAKLKKDPNTTMKSE